MVRHGNESAFRQHAGQNPQQLRIDVFGSFGKFSFVNTAENLKIREQLPDLVYVHAGLNLEWIETGYAAVEKKGYQACAVPVRIDKDYLDAVVSGNIGYFFVSRY